MTWRSTNSSSRSMRNKQQGFTLVELMIATTVFTVILLLVAATVVRITSGYQKSLVETTTQNVARSILDTLAEGIQFGGVEPQPLGAPANGWCVNGTRYKTNAYAQLEDPLTSFALVEEKGTGYSCDLAAVTSQEMLSPHMRLSNFDISNVGLPIGMSKITVKVAYGDNDVFIGSSATGPNPICKPDKGSQWCAVRELSATVQRRL